MTHSLLWRACRSFERVSEQLKEAIVDGRLKSGDRLPPETELAAKLHVGRQTVREALRMLEHAGLLETPKRGSGGGTVVRNGIPATISGLFVDAFRMDSISVDELNEARASFEQVILKFAIERANEEDIRLLSENTAESRRLVAAGVEASDNDLEFHRLLAQCSKNRVIELVADALLCVLRVHAFSHSAHAADVRRSRSSGTRPSSRLSRRETSRRRSQRCSITSTPFSMTYGR